MKKARREWCPQASRTRQLDYWLRRTANNETTCTRTLPSPQFHARPCRSFESIAVHGRFWRGYMPFHASQHLVTKTYLYTFWFPDIRLA